MGNSHPKNKTGRKETAQKIENAKKLGVLSLTEHGFDGVPEAVYALTNLKTLDLSKNNLTHLSDKLALMKDLKILKLDENKLAAGSLTPVKNLGKLQTLSLANNLLGKPIHADPSSPKQSQPPVLPTLPTSLKHLVLSSNSLSLVPPSVVAASLTKLEKLDLSGNNLSTIPTDIANLTNLQELILDDNSIVSLPEEIGKLSKLKVLSLKGNQITVSSTKFSEQNPQPLPASLFRDTGLIDLNLHGNPMTNTQLNEFDGFQDFLDRRQKVKSKTLSNLDVCGLK